MVKLETCAQCLWCCSCRWSHSNSHLKGVFLVVSHIATCFGAAMQVAALLTAEEASQVPVSFSSIVRGLTHLAHVSMFLHLLERLLETACDTLVCTIPQCCLKHTHHTHTHHSTHAPHNHTTGLQNLEQTHDRQRSVINQPSMGRSMSIKTLCVRTVLRFSLMRKSDHQPSGLKSRTLRRS